MASIIPSRRVTASAGAASAARGTPHAEWLLLVAAVVLVAFYYGGRADAVGVLNQGRAWQSLTRPPLAPPVHFVLSGLLLGLAPVLAARWLLGAGLADLGLGVGNWREGLRWLAAGVPLALLAGRIGAADPAIRAVYPLDALLTPDRLLPHAGVQVFYFAAWEVLFRGVLLFGLRHRFGDRGANLLQTALSVVAHFGRPEGEVLAAIPAGYLFGWIALRIRSVWYIAIVHWLVGASLDAFIVWHAW